MLLASASKYFRNRNIHLRTGWAYSLTAIPTSFLLARCKDAINEAVPLANIIALAVVLSVFALVYRFFICDQQETEYDDRGIEVGRILLLGVLLGCFIGATSISGSLIILALMLVLRMPAKMAIGTPSFVAIFPLTAASVAHVMEGDVNWSVVTLFAPAVMAGASVGAKLTNALPVRRVQVMTVSLLFVAEFGIFGTHAFVGKHTRQAVVPGRFPMSVAAAALLPPVQAIRPQDGAAKLRGGARSRRSWQAREERRLRSIGVRGSIGA
jgi:uncharacterized membrane protein YfcA